MITKIDLMRHRLEQARECLNIAETIVDASTKTAANRSYYCIFHAMRAVLALDEFDSKKHSGIISYFRQNYIKTGKFNADFSNTIGKAFEIRGDSDYQDFYVVSKQDVLEQIENAKRFLEAVEGYLNTLSEVEKHALS